MDTRLRIRRGYIIFLNLQMGESTEENLRKNDGEIKKPDAVTQMHAAAVNGDKALLAKIIVCECQEAYVPVLVNRYW